MSHYVEADYLVINDVFDDALRELQAIVRSQRLQTDKQAHRHSARLRALLG
ncbi:guanylate kinase (GMP kinase) [gamma proteobacterium NOR5-3]|nr:guanylate kinase (GMP kinase) [gamma proteobacterium NOR5-3]